MLDASQKGGLVKYANSTCVADEVNVKLYRVVMGNGLVNIGQLNIFEREI